MTRTPDPSSYCQGPMCFRCPMRARLAFMSPACPVTGQVTFHCSFSLLLSHGFPEKASSLSVAQADLSLYLRLASTSQQSSCLGLLSTEVTSMNYPLLSLLLITSPSHFPSPFFLFFSIHPFLDFSIFPFAGSAKAKRLVIVWEVLYNRQLFAL